MWWTDIGFKITSQIWTKIQYVLMAFKYFKQPHFKTPEYPFKCSTALTRIQTDCSWILNRWIKFEELRRLFLKKCSTPNGFMVTCQHVFAEKKVWTVLSHNGTAPIQVQGSSPKRPHIVRLSYNASAEQMRSIVSGSEHCQQEVVYNCKKSRLFNAKGEFTVLQNVKL